MKDYPHLPRGHEPGPQSIRNRRGAPLLWWFVVLVGAAMFVAGVFVAAGGRGSKFDPIEELEGGAVFGGTGLLLVLVAYWQYRKFRPAMLGRRLRGASLSVDSDELERGGRLTATLELRQAASELEVGLVCTEAFDVISHSQTQAGIIDIRQTSRATAWEEWQPVEAAPGSSTFRFTVPSDQPYSYEGDCLSYAWRVSVRRVERLRADPRIDHPIWVRP